MKKTIIILASCALLLASCSDTLTEEPYAVAAETFYNTTAEMDAALLGPIQRLHEGWGSLTCFMLAIPEAMSDVNYGRGSWRNLDEYNAMSATNYGRTDELYSHLYRAIMECNVPLSRLPESQLNDAEKTQYEASFRFLRGFCYFFLVKAWNKAIIRTPENMNVRDMAFSRADAVWQFLIEDLEFAAQNAPDAATPGLPTKWGAMAILTDVYLWQKDYARAASYAKQIMDSGKFSLVSVSTVEDFDKVFGPDANATSEEIFYGKFTNSVSGYGNAYCQLFAGPTSFLVRGHAMCGPGGWVGLTCYDKMPLIQDWPDNDLRKQYDLAERDLGDNVGKQYLIAKFCDPNNPSGGNDNPVMRYADILLAFAEATAMQNGAPTAECIEALNQIHRRAYGLDPTTPSDIDYKLDDYATLDKFNDLLDTEEAYETYGEGKRYWFLRRRGTLVEAVKKQKGIDITESQLYWHIPQGEYDNNQLVTQADQNPGY